MSSDSGLQWFWVSYRSAVHTEASLTGIYLNLLPLLQNIFGNVERGFNILMLGQAYVTKIKQIENILSQEKNTASYKFRTQALKALPKFW